MPKRPDTLETVRLILELARRIPRNRSVSTAELHEAVKNAGFDCDVRTIQRHLKTLSEHFDIERDDRSKPYGWRWKERAELLAVASLTPNESLLLQLAEEYLKNLLPPQLMKSMASFFEQAKRNLGPASTAQLEREWPRKVRVVATSQPLLPPQIDRVVFEAVTEALYANRMLRVSYRNSGDEQKDDRHVMPLGLAQQGSCLYLVCRFEGYDNERSLKLNRIQSATVLPQGFTRPKEFDLKKFDEDGQFGFGRGKRIRLTFRISKDAGLQLLETQLSHDQKVAVLPDDEGYEIRATVVDSAMLTWWLRGFGEDVWDIRRKAMPASTSARQKTREADANAH